MTKKTYLDQVISLLKQNKGFSLIETAISLTILGIILGSTLPLYHQYRQLYWDKVTHDHQEYILMALAQYVLHNRVMPCPATATTDGLALNTCENPLENIGRVPYRTLGIPETYAQDGPRNFFTFVVPPSLTRVHITERPSLREFFEERVGLEFLDAHNQPVIAPPHQDIIAVILLSYPPLDPNVTMQEFVRRPFAFSSSVKARWILRSHLMRHYGGYSSPHLIEDAPPRPLIEEGPPSF